MAKRFFCIILLLVASVSFAFATINVDYDFDINGLMFEFVLREQTGIPEEAKYETVSDFETAVENYKSKLVNLRCFTDVDYAINYDKADHAVVVFTVNVAKSMLALPYPKYDSNNGFSLKFKVVDNNFLGALGKIDFTAIMLGTDTEKTFDSTWQKFSDYKLTGTFSNVKIKGTTISGSVESVLKFGYLKTSFDAFRKNSYAKGSVSVSNIKIGENLTLGTSVSLNTSGNKPFSDWKNMWNNFSIYASLKAFDINVSPAFSATYFPFKGVIPENTYHIFSLGLSGFKFAGGVFSITPSVRFNFSGDKFSTKYVYYYLNSISYYKGRLNLSNSTYWYYPKNTKSENIETVTTIGYRFNNNITPSISGTFRYYPGDIEKTYVEFTEMASTNFTILTLPINLSVGLMERPFIFTNSFNLGFLGNFSTSVDRLNYTEGEFRLGYKLNWVADAKYAPFNEIFNVDSGDGKKCPSYIRTRFQFTWFPVELGGWLNPSMRVTATYSNIPFYHYSKRDYKGSPYAYYFNEDSLDEDPKGYGIDYTNRTQTILLGEYLRGIRNDNEDAISIEDDNIAVVVNLNATAKFIKLGNLADTYVNPFMDFAIIQSTEDKTKNKKFLTVGFEGIGVLKNHPSYPIRASLGFNAEKLVDYIKHKTEEFPEYELYLGLYHFFEYKH